MKKVLIFILSLVTVIQSNDLPAEAQIQIADLEYLIADKQETAKTSIFPNIQADARKHIEKYQQQIDFIKSRKKGFTKEEFLQMEIDDLNEQIQDFPQFKEYTIKERDQRQAELDKMRGVVGGAKSKPLPLPPLAQDQWALYQKEIDELNQKNGELKDSKSISAKYIIEGNDNKITTLKARMKMITDTKRPLSEKYFLQEEIDDITNQLKAVKSSAAKEHLQKVLQKVKEKMAQLS